MYIAKSKVISTKRQMFYGFLFTSASGVILHYLYEWTGRSTTVSLFSPINESPWEHLKIIFFPILFFLIIQLVYLRCKKIILHNLTWFSALSAVIAMSFITVAYYTFVGITGMNVGWYNISLFFIASAIAYFFNYRMVKGHSKRIPLSGVYGFFIFLIFIVIFVVFTLSPPDIPWFVAPQ